jgi:Ser/Thr protein kinase RdoA (MazF antagonist)
VTPPDLSAFGIHGDVTPLPGGHRNAVWRVAGPGGPLIAKSTMRSEAALRWLLPVQAAARTAGFAVPGMIAAPDGRLAPQGWTLEPFVPGRPATAADLAALLPRLQDLHRATAAWPQRPGFASARALITGDRGGDVDMTALPADLALACRAAWAALSGDDCAIHGDLTPGNVLLTPEGPALLDWDEARCDLPAFDTLACAAPDAIITRAHLAWEVACGWRREPGYARALAARLLSCR